MKRTGFLALLVCIVSIVHAQPKGASLWFTTQLPVDFSKKWQWHNDLSYKSNGTSLIAYQRFYRTGLRYRISSRLNVAGGIAFVSTQTSSGNKEDDEFGREFRFWEEMIYQVKLNSRWTLQNRIRTEERFLRATTLKPASRILNLSDKITLSRALSKKWDVQVADEYFEQVISKQFLYNQNRLSAVGTYNVNSKFQISAGYIWALRKTFSQHILQFTIRKIFSAYGRHDNSSE